MRALLVVLVLLLLAACVQIPEEPLAPPVVEPEANVTIPPPAQPISPPAPNATQPSPLAPLPEPPKNVTTPPAVQTNLTPPKAGKANVLQTWTTEALSIAEGETKIVYVKK